jgi:hypothetical protein
MQMIFLRNMVSVSVVAMAFSAVCFADIAEHGGQGNVWDTAADEAAPTEGAAPMTTEEAAPPPPEMRNKVASSDNAEPLLAPEGMAEEAQNTEDMMPTEPTDVPGISGGDMLKEESDEQIAKELENSADTDADANKELENSADTDADANKVVSYFPPVIKMGEEPLGGGLTRIL